MSEKIIDLKDVMARVQDDKDLLLELFDIFETYYPEKREEMEGLLKQQDMEAVRDIIHSIKGAAGNISAKIMHQLCMGIEMLADQKNVDDVTKGLKDLDEQFTAVKKEMEKIRKNIG